MGRILTMAVLRPREAASIATPEPVAPPPMTRISKDSVFSRSFCSFREGGSHGKIVFPSSHVIIKLSFGSLDAIKFAGTHHFRAAPKIFDQRTNAAHSELAIIPAHLATDPRCTHPKICTDGWIVCDRRSSTHTPTSLQQRQGWRRREPSFP
jgi:hypothetical protein